MPIDPMFTSCDASEFFVMVFQVCGVLGLCFSRLVARSTRLAIHGRTGLIVSLFGLGVAGALCGRHDSEFALFAGVTMTLLLIGMTVGSGAAEALESVPQSVPSGVEMATAS